MDIVVKKYESDILIIDNLCSKEECQELISRFDNLMTKCQSTSSYRDMYRTEYDNPELSTVIFEKIRNFVPSVLDVKPTDSQYGKTYKYEGIWNLTKLNSFWRIGKYTEGGKFAKHRDGLYQPSLDCRSFYTFMIYLNDEYEGGQTTFYLDSGEISFKLKQGSAIIFPHNLLHEGTPIISGVKYIMRSDIMFETPLSNERFTQSEFDAFSLFLQAVQLENDNPSAAVQLYHKSRAKCQSLQDFF